MQLRAEVVVGTEADVILQPVAGTQTLPTLKRELGLRDLIFARVWKAGKRLSALSG